MSISTKVVFNRKTMEQVTESRRKPIVVGIGELLWDMLPSGKKAGGAPINFVYHASCLGLYISSKKSEEPNHRIRPSFSQEIDTAAANGPSTSPSSRS